MLNVYVDRIVVPSTIAYFKLVSLTSKKDALGTYSFTIKKNFLENVGDSGFLPIDSRSLRDSTLYLSLNWGAEEFRYAPKTGYYELPYSGLWNGVLLYTSKDTDPAIYAWSDYIEESIGIKVTSIEILLTSKLTLIPCGTEEIGVSNNYSGHNKYVQEEFLNSSGSSIVHGYLSQEVLMGSSINSSTLTPTEVNYNPLTSKRLKDLGTVNYNGTSVNSPKYSYSDRNISQFIDFPYIATFTDSSLNLNNCQLCFDYLRVVSLYDKTWGRLFTMNNKAPIQLIGGLTEYKIFLQGLEVFRYSSSRHTFEHKSTASSSWSSFNLPNTIENVLFYVTSYYDLCYYCLVVDVNTNKYYVQGVAASTSGVPCRVLADEFFSSYNNFYSPNKTGVFFNESETVIKKLWANFYLSYQALKLCRARFATNAVELSDTGAIVEGIKYIPYSDLYDSTYNRLRVLPNNSTVTNTIFYGETLTLAESSLRLAKYYKGDSCNLILSLTSTKGLGTFRCDYGSFTSVVISATSLTFQSSGNNLVLRLGDLLTHDCTLYQSYSSSDFNWYYGSVVDPSKIKSLPSGTKGFISDRGISLIQNEGGIQLWQNPIN